MRLMSNRELVSKSLQDLKELIAKEQNPHNLRELVAEINSLLDLIELQVARIEGEKPPAAN
jgi:hypothetical protein